MDERPATVEPGAPAGRRPGWLWVPLAVTLLLIALVIISGLLFGG